jgi:hypothetical protein
MPKKTAAKKTPAKRPRSRVAGSMADQINNLEPGQCVAIATRFDIEGGGHGGGLPTELSRMRSSQAAYVARITDELDAREFRVESGTFVTNDNTGVMACVVITRME